MTSSAFTRLKNAFLGLLALVASVVSYLGFNAPAPMQPNINTTVNLPTVQSAVNTSRNANNSEPDPNAPLPVQTPAQAPPSPAPAVQPQQTADSSVAQSVPPMETAVLPAAGHIQEDVSQQLEDFRTQYDRVMGRGGAQ